MRSGNFYLRRNLDLFAGLRTGTLPSGHRVRLVRENLEDHYGAVEWMATPDVAQAVKICTRQGTARIARFALDLAARTSRHLTVVHKANNLKLTEGLFLGVAAALAAEYPHVRCDDLLADAAAGRMVAAPDTLDVILTSNTFGDLLANVLSAVCGGEGGIACLNVGPGVAVAEGSHGSADRLAGTGRANPLAPSSPGPSC